MRELEPIAIVGFSCRFPGGADRPEAFWKLLANGVDAVGPVPEDRWHIASLYHPDYQAPGRIHQRQGGFVDRIDEFDASFFGLSPREARRTDPQHRLLLETSWRALEHAGIPPSSLIKSRTGVFVGISTHDYCDITSSAPERMRIGSHTNQGTAQSIAANRVSYCFDLRGPSLAVDTACSSTITALHLAVQAIRGGDCDAALIGGANALLKPEPTIGFSKGSFLSARGRCQAFSKHADGFVRAEGAAMFVLMPLSRARKEGRRILGAVLRTGVNEDGHTDGMALPSAEAQAELLASTWDGIHPEQLGYFEAHGTGTPAGDPIEAGAIGKSLGLRRKGGDPIPVGSVKTNVGHLEAAAGCPQIAKLLLSFQHRRIPASLHSAELNPQIDFKGLNLEVVRQLRDWPNGRPLAAINSFGFGGANAHAVLSSPEALPEVVRPMPVGALTPARPVLGLLSARSEAALRALAQAHLEAEPQDLADTAFTAAKHREHQPHRAALVARDENEWREGLIRIASGGSGPGVIAGHARPASKVAFVFSGHGPEWWGMAQGLLRHDPIFRGTVERLDGVLRPHLGWSVLAELARDEKTARFSRTEITQPVLFAIQMGLVARLESLGIRPGAVVGHSIGEVAAACASGCIAESDAAMLVATRGRAMQSCPEGRMLAVGLPENELRARLAEFDGRLALAAVNRPDLCVASGTETDIDELAKSLVAAQIFHRKLTVKFGFHSHLMEGAVQPVVAAISGLQPREGHLAFYSTIAGGPLPGRELGPSYWAKNVRNPVLFVPALRAMVRDGFTTFVEVSPHPVLSPGVEAVLAEKNVEGQVVPSMHRESGDEEKFLLESAGALYVRGHAVEPARPGRFVDVPYTPWERQRFWIESRRSQKERTGPRLHPHVSAHREGTGKTDHHVFDLDFDTHAFRWLDDHRVQGALVVPGAALLEAARACGEIAWGKGAWLAEVQIERALILPEGDADEARLEVVLEADGDDGHFWISSRPEGDGPWTRHATGRIERRSMPWPGAPFDARGMLGATRPLAEGKALYPQLAEKGLQFGPAFQTLDKVAGGTLGNGARVAVCAVHAPKPEGFGVHPILLDACFQAVIGAAGTAESPVPRIYLPVGMSAVRWTGISPEGPLHAAVRLDLADARTVIASMALVDEQGRAIVEVDGFEGRALEGSERGTDPREHLFDLRWLPKDLPGGGRQSNVRLPPVKGVDLDPVEREVRARIDSRAWVAHSAQLDAYAHVAARHALIERLGPIAAGQVIDPNHPALAGGSPRLRIALLELLSRAGDLQPTGDSFAAVRPLERADLAALEAKLRTQEEFAGTTDALILAARALPSVLVGKQEGPAALFGDKDGTAAMERFYATCPALTPSYQLLRDALGQALRDLPADRALRVLEIGAGTGGLTAAILGVFPDDRVEYWFTDASSTFLDPALKRFGRPGFEAREFDLAGETELPAGGFDLVLASGALDLSRAEKLLGTGGWLAAIEPGALPAWTGLLFGLTGQNAAVPVSRWRELLGAAGFRAPRTLADSLGEHVVILAEKAGPSQPRMAADSLKAAVIGSRLGSALSARLGASLIAPSALASLSPLPETIIVTCPADLDGSIDAADQSALHDAQLEPLIRLGKALSRTTAKHRVILVTSGAIAALPGEPADVRQAPAWGTARVLFNEVPSASWRHVDLPASPSDADLDALAAECRADVPDLDVAIRGDRRFVLQVDRAADPGAIPAPAADGEAWRVEVGTPGVLASALPHHVEVPPPGPGQVEIDVRATGLNFKDLLRSMGMLPGVQRGGLGLECSGIVTRVGPGVEVLHEGDRVMAVTGHGAASRLLADARLVARIPDSIGFPEAATLPIAMGTAWYCLEHLGRMRPGEIVLVHAATGGVGHAAIQLAKRRGARVIGTAGSPSKRAYLKEKLGVEHAFDSRSLDFAREVLEATKGRGVDLVLNSLAGAAIDRSIACMAPYGRFLEIGVRDIWANKRIGLQPFRANLSYFAVELEQMMQQRPDEFRAAALEPLAEALRRGEIGPLPVTSFPLDAPAPALNEMARARHMGKLVLVRDARKPVKILRKPPPFQPRPDRTWLITGGTRGFGLSLAGWLVGLGVRHLALLSKSGRPDEAGALQIAAWRDQGIDVRTEAVDVGNRAELERELSDLRGEMPRLGGVIHAAMVLDDAPFDHLDKARFLKVLEPKAAGAVHLDRLTKDDDLDAFLLLSSAALVGGNPGQANYAAANAVLESVAWDRRARGLPATVVNLSALSDTGVVARNAAVLQALARSGLLGTSQSLALKLVGLNLAEGATQRVTGRLDWPVLAAGALKPSASRFARLLSRASGSGAAGQKLRDRMLALPAPQRLAGVTAALRVEFGTVLGAKPDAIPTDRKITELGLDSLMVGQLSAWLRKEAGVDVPPMRLLKGPTLAELAADVCRDLENAAGSNVAPAKEEIPPTAVSAIQESIWRDHQRWPGSVSLRIAVRFSGALDVTALSSAWEQVVDRHPLLRSVFSESAGILTRRDGPRPPLAITVIPGADLAKLRERAAAEVGTLFDPSREPPARAALFRGDGVSVLAIALHHLAYDAVTSFAIVEELRAAYRRLAGADAHAAEKPSRYEDFLVLERTRLKAEARASMVETWKRKLEGRPLKLDLGRVERISPGDWLMAGGSRAVPAEVAHKLEERGRKAGTTLFGALLAGWMHALHNETGQVDLIAGTSVSLRESEELLGGVGPMINFVPVRVLLNGGDFGHSLTAVGGALADAMDRRWLPIGDLVSALSPPAEADTLPRLGLNHNFHLYDADAFGRTTTAAGQRAAGVAEFAPGIEVGEVNLPEEAPIRPYELTCGIWHLGGALRIGVRANVRNPGEAFAHRMLDRFVTVLTEATRETK